MTFPRKTSSHLQGRTSYLFDPEACFFEEPVTSTTLQRRHNPEDCIVIATTVRTSNITFFKMTKD
jgi:hypothetical protein